MALALSAGANAAIVTCVSTVTSIFAGTNSASFSCDGLTFSNFQLLNLTGANSGRFDIDNVTFDTATGMVTMNENPNLGSAGHENLLFLLFQVTGSVSAIDLSMGGT